LNSKDAAQGSEHSQTATAEQSFGAAWSVINAAVLAATNALKRCEVKSSATDVQRMGSTVYCQLGKIGDILSILSLLEHYSKRDKAPVNLVIAKQYAGVVENLDYINPVIFDGHWQSLSEAIKFAKQRFDHVIVPQTYGKDTPIEHRTPSFQYDQWLRAGGLALWDKLPLTIPRNGNLAADYGVDRNTILFADQGESSPFEHVQRLAGLLQNTFAATHRVVLLSGIRLERFTDFVQLYDAAACLIVTETAHLHLAKATKTPTFALVTDKPERWHGSAWSKTHKLHIRYSQYGRRERELIEGLRSVL
jgi:ADP-heptose:LPS heptosyltransferase